MLYPSNSSLAFGLILLTQETFMHKSFTDFVWPDGRSVRDIYSTPMLKAYYEEQLDGIIDRHLKRNKSCGAVTSAGISFGILNCDTISPVLCEPKGTPPKPVSSMQAS